MKTLVLLALLVIAPLTHAATPVNINTADASLLDTLPGIGPVRAEAIISYRQAHGPFTKIEDLDKVSGIGPVTVQNLQGLITVGARAPVAPRPTPVDETKPSAPSASSHIVQKNEGALTKVSPQVHEKEAVVAPATAVNAVVAGASVATVASSPSGLLSSPWLYGFLGLLVFSSIALIVL